MQRHDPSNSPSRPSSRRVPSAASSPRITSFGPTPQQQDAEEKKPLTASEVAAEHFKKELAYQNGDQQLQGLETVVIIQDACYGHRYSRPKTSKATLSLIVERPERLQASIIGMSSAYVRLSGAFAGGSNAPQPQRQPSAAVPFRIQKTARSVPLTSPAVTAVHGSKWMQELTFMCDAADSKLASGSKELLRPDTPTGSADSKPRLHEGDLYLCGESLDSLQGALGGVYDAIDTVFQNSVATPTPTRAFVCIRPPGHHCSADHPSGFCWLNNIHVGIEHAAQAHGLTHAAIIDFDLHHGDGSQAITWERNLKAAKSVKASSKNGAPQRKPQIGYFSLHDVNSYPCEDGNLEKVQAASTCIENQHSQNIWNVHLQPWTTEAEFWDHYGNDYKILLSKARAFLHSQSSRLKAATPSIVPKGAIFLSSGFDASQWEMDAMQRHKVNVPTEFYARFTADVVKLAEDDLTGVQGRIISVLEGGYSDRALMSGVLSHLTGLVGRTPKLKTEGTDVTMAESVKAEPTENLNAWDNTWWSHEALLGLESLVRETPKPMPPPKKTPRNMEMPTYTSPTQSFTAKVVDPAKVIRSTSGSSQAQLKSRSTTPPPPEVDWATSVHELCKQLIPNDRQVNSLRHDELKEPRVKKERQSSIGLPSVETSRERMQLRGRRAKVTAEAAATSDATKAALPIREASEASRRRTISDLSSVSHNGPGYSNVAVAPSVESDERPNTSTSSNKSGRLSQGSPTGPSRSSSNSVQPPSGREAAQSLRIQKTRRVSGGKTTPQPLSSAPTIPPLPAAPQTKQRQNALNAPAEKKVMTSKPKKPNTDPEVDGITTGVKKITLKLPTESKSGPVAKSSSQTTAKPGRKPKAVSEKTSVEKGSVNSKAGSKPMEVSTSQAGIVAKETSAGAKPPTESEFALEEGIGGSQQASHVDPMNKPSQAAERGEQGVSTPKALSGSSGRTADRDGDVRPGKSENGKIEFVPYVHPENNNRQAEHFHSAQEPLTWLPPNSGTPEQFKRGKENLPVFTAQGHIPFAVPSKNDYGRSKQGANWSSRSQQGASENDQAGNGLTRAGEKNEQALWEVPGTPSKG